MILGIPTYSTTFDHCNQKDKCHDTLDNANTRCLSDGFHAEVTGSQLLEIVSFGSAGHEPADDNENCMRSGKINVSQQVIDQQAILMKILLSSNNCTVVAWRCCPIWTCSTLFLILSSQQGKAQQSCQISHRQGHR